MSMMNMCPTYSLFRFSCLKGSSWLCIQKLKINVSYRSYSGTFSKEDSPNIEEEQLTPLEEYNKQIKLGLLTNDPYQRNIIKSLSTFHTDLVNYNPPVIEKLSILHIHKPSWRDKFKIFPFQGRNNNKTKNGPIDNIPLGVYLYGDVGCGKTMLMDLFYKSIPFHLSKKRIHFHQFMQNIHKRSHEILVDYNKYTGNDTQDIDVVPYLASEIAHGSRILCFDEFQVTDVADAMLLRRLFSILLSSKYGVVLFATSNRHPDELYINGVQRKSFIPCIELIKERTNVIQLDSETDYRKIPKPMSSVYYYPKDGLKYDSQECKLSRQNHVDEWYNYFAQQETNNTNIDNAHTDGIITSHKTHINFPLSIWGREFVVPKCVPQRVAQFTFRQLCGEPLAAGDYLMLAKNFDAFIVTDIPYLSIYVRGQIRRFITFLDAIYDNGGKLATTGAAEFSSLFVEPEMLLNDYELTRLETMTHSVNSKFQKNKKNAPKHESHSVIEDELINKHGFSKDVAETSNMFLLDEERFAFARALSRLSQMSSTDWVTKRYNH